MEFGIAETLIVPQWNQWNKFACCCCTKYPRKIFTPKMLWNTWSSCWDIYFFPLNSWGTKFLNNNKAPTKLSHQKLLYKKPFTQIERKNSKARDLLSCKEEIRSWKKKDVDKLEEKLDNWTLGLGFEPCCIDFIPVWCCLWSCAAAAAAAAEQDSKITESSTPFIIQLASHRFCELFKNQEKQTEEHFVHGFWCYW